MRNRGLVCATYLIAWKKQTWHSIVGSVQVNIAISIKLKHIVVAESAEIDSLYSIISSRP